MSDKDWGFAAPYLMLVDISAPQCKCELHEMFNALRWRVRAGPPGPAGG
ncbi:protein of unknown function [Paraburkholderia kururiensis]